MKLPDSQIAFESEVKGRFGILPNFFRSAHAAPELIQQLWSFARAGYLDNPIPALFKERLFVTLSRLCPMRYCIVRHVGFLLGHGWPAGEAGLAPHSISDVVRLLKRPTPWQRDMPSIYARLGGLTEPLVSWPEPRSEMEDLIFACAAVVFAEPARGEPARLALLKALGPRQFEYLIGCLLFIRTAHYWTMLHPEIETEEDMRILLRDHEELARLLIEDSEADRCEMGARLFDELMALRDLHEREELTLAKDALEEKDRQKDQFIAILAHELRNPLAAVRAAVDAMGLIKLETKVERLRERLDRQSTIMTRMLDDLLDAARIASGKTSIQIEDIVLNDLLYEIVGENEERVRAAGIGFEFEISNLPCPVRGDRVRLRQIIDNLLSNAIKFTPAPGRVTVRLRREGSSAILQIEDTGVGFDSAFAGRLFEPFTQQEQPPHSFNGGLGLGLAISKKLAELQGCSLSGESPGRVGGATFTLTLPLAAASPATTIPADEIPRRTDRRRVLLIEDNKDVSDALAELISLFGFDVDVAYDGRSALTRAIAGPPDLILCDIGLSGGMDGYAVARALRVEPRLCLARLIAVSGYSQPKDHADAKQAGFDRLVPKPLTVEILKALLNEPALQ